MAGTRFPSGILRNVAVFCNVVYFCLGVMQFKTASEKILVSKDLATKSY